MNVSIILGNKTLELRPSSVDKATATRSILRDFGKVDFVMCLGDGKTDEVVFQALGDSFEDVSVTSTVGKKQTCAKYFLEDVAGVIDLLQDMAGV